jgi:rhodanese-related sulfurtransferase
MSFLPIAKEPMSLLRLSSQDAAGRTTRREKEETMQAPTHAPASIAGGSTHGLGEHALPQDAARHFEAQLAFETDCYDVNEALRNRRSGFVVLDVRSPRAYATGHVPGAVSLPHGRIDELGLAAYPQEVLFVVYCSGPHCNGADRAALRLARLGRPVKKMIGGIEGWKDEGLGLEK